MTRQKRVNWYDFQKASLEDMQTDQGFHAESVALTNKNFAGTGVLLDLPEERVIFNSASLTVAQSGYSVLSTFDGRGILAEEWSCSDLQEGNQISVTVTDSRLGGVISMYVTLLGTDFQDNVIYEHLEIPANGTYLTLNHFKKVINILFNNFLGNGDTTVDGYGSFRTEGTVVVAEASSYKPTADLVVAKQILEPDIIFRDYKLYDPGKTLDQVITEALGASYDIDDLDINTTYPLTRTFDAGASTDTIYGQKFRMVGNNIQKISILLGLSSGTNWSGTINVGIRALQTSVSDSSITTFLPDSEIEFDPTTSIIEEISLSKDDLEERGIILNDVPQPVDFVFTSSNISNPSLSTLEDGKFYILTIKRSGSSTTGTLFLPEIDLGTVSDGAGRISILSSGVWTDIADHSMWYKIYGDSFRVASGTAFDGGYRIESVKTQTDDDGETAQYFETGIAFTSTSEGTENYLVVERTETFSDRESHPSTGDEQYARTSDAPEFSTLLESEVETLLGTRSDTVVLARGIDTNPRSNPEITGSVFLPGLAISNWVDVLNPSSDLLNHNVVGSIITPNTLKPTLRYRIISQTAFTDGYGDLNSDDLTDLDDLARIQALDGYSTDLNSGSVSSVTQVAAILNGSVSILEILKGDLDGSGVVDATDVVELSTFLTDGTAFSGGGSQFTRVRLELEPLTGQLNYLNSDAESTLRIEDEDTDLVTSSFATINFSIEYVPSWRTEFVEVTDLRRFVASTFLDFSISNLQSTTETGGSNSLFVPGDIYLTGNVKNLDGTFHALDYERVVLELDLPDGDTVAEINIFDTFVKSKMSFSDGSLVPVTAISDNQVRFEISIGSHVKNAGVLADGYIDYSGVSDDADESIGLYMDHDTGLLRIRAYHIVHNELLPEIRTRILVAISLKKAGFANAVQKITSDQLSALITAI